MNNRFNMYSRTEEEKTRDIMLYEKKARAGAIAKAYEKANKLSDLVTVIAAVAAFAVAAPFFYKAYDSESILGMILIILGAVLIVASARLITGAVRTRSLFVYMKWGSLSSKWTIARKDMHDYEAKFAEQTVFEPDLKKAEKALMDASDRLIAFAEKHDIKYEV